MEEVCRDLTYKCLNMQRENENMQFVMNELRGRGGGASKKSNLVFGKRCFIISIKRRYFAFLDWKIAVYGFELYCFSKSEENMNP